MLSCSVSDLYLPVSSHTPKQQAIVTHPFIYMDKECFQNYYYLSPHDFLQEDKRPVVQWRLQNIKVRSSP